MNGNESTMDRFLRLQRERYGQDSSLAHDDIWNTPSFDWCSCGRRTWTHESEICARKFLMETDGQ